jgi:hypothetical protein
MECQLDIDKLRTLALPCPNESIITNGVVNMALYEARIARPFPGFPIPDASVPTPRSVSSLLPGSSVPSMTAFEGGYTIAIEMDRDDHSAAMTELATALQQLGFTVLEAAITEFIDSLLEGAAVGAASGAALGAASKSGEGFLWFFVGGLAAGALLGSSQKRVKARYVARRPFPGTDWQISRFDLDPPDA